MPELIIWPVWIGTLCGWCMRFWCIGPGWWWWCEYEWCVVGVQTFWNEYRQLRRMSCVCAPSLPMAKLRRAGASRRRCMRSIERFSGADMKIGGACDTCVICDEECCRWAAVAVKCIGVCDWPWWWSKFSFFNSGLHAKYEHNKLVKRFMFFSHAYLHDSVWHIERVS